MQFLDKFRRITTSGEYFPEIDGLRFIAIFTVVLFHIMASVRYPEPLIDSKFTAPWLTAILRNGWQGVELFFAISGFIIGLPFAKQYINGGKKVNLKAYFMRRITRLEPPYLVMIILFFLFLVLTGQNTVSQKLPSLLASMVYMNNVIFNDIQGLVISVIWSLEIEVQFYILAVLFSTVFMLPKIPRRLVILGVIYGFPILQYYYYPDVKTIYLYLEYFFIGFLLADLYISKPKGIYDLRFTIYDLQFGINYLLSKIGIRKSIANNKLKILEANSEIVNRKSKIVNQFIEVFLILLGFLTLGVLLYIDHGLDLKTKFIYISCMIIFYYLAMHNKFWKKVMSTKWVATIGGMCYTIYLIHGTIILTYSRKAYLFRTSDYFLPNYFLNFLILVPIILVVSGLYFRLIERPCMDRNWPKKLKEYFIRTFSKKVALETSESEIKQ